MNKNIFIWMFVLILMIVSVNAGQKNVYCENCEANTIFVVNGSSDFGMNLCGVNHIIYTRWNTSGLYLNTDESGCFGNITTDMAGSNLWYYYDKNNLSINNSPSNVFTSNVYVFYDFGDGTTSSVLPDRTSSARNGIPQAPNKDPEYQSNTGFFGGEAMYFDGCDERATCESGYNADHIYTDSVEPVFYSDLFTIVMRVNATKRAGDWNYHFWSKQDGTGVNSDDEFALVLVDTGTTEDLLLSLLDNSDTACNLWLYDVDVFNDEYETLIASYDRSNTISTIKYGNRTNSTTCSTDIVNEPNGHVCIGTSCGSYYVGGRFNGLNGTISEASVYDIALTDAQKNSISNTSAWTISDIASPIGDIIFKNSTGSIKSNFNEREDVYLFYNYTLDNGQIIDDTNASCNTTLYDAYSEYYASNLDFNLCSTGCDYLTYTEEFNPESDSVIKDVIHFQGCHEQTSFGSVSVLVDCGTNSSLYSILPSQLPLCSNGIADIFIDDYSCLDKTSVNISIESNVPYGQRKQIKNLNLDREFSSHTKSMLYNSSSKLWYSDHHHEYYEHGTYDIDVNCSHDTSIYSINTSESLTIVNVPPVISFSQVISPSSIYYNLTDGAVYEFEDGTWTFTGAIIDDDADTLKVKWLCANGTILYNVSGDPLTTTLNVHSDNFSDFDCNPFEIEVWVNDSVGDSDNQTISFNFTDTTDPVCDFPSEYRQLNSTSLNFNINCVDEHFYSLNVTCPANNYTFFVDGLDTTSYTFNETITNAVWDTCSYRYADGHTANKLKHFWNPITYDSEIDLIADGELIANVKSLTAGASVSYDIKHDRVSYTFDLSHSLNNQFTFIVQTSPNSKYLPSDEYQGWIIIDNNYWLDFNSDQLDANDKVKVKNLGDGLWEIVVKVKDNKIIEFESIGELNVVEGSFVINDLLLQEKDPKTSFTSTGEALMWILLIGLWVISVIGTLTLTGRHGDTIQLLNIFQFVCGLLVGIGFMEYNFPIGFLMILFSTGLMLGKFVEQ